MTTVLLNILMLIAGVVLVALALVDLLQEADKSNEAHGTIRYTTQVPAQSSDPQMDAFAARALADMKSDSPDIEHAWWKDNAYSLQVYGHALAYYETVENHSTHRHHVTPELEKEIRQTWQQLK